MADDNSSPNRQRDVKISDFQGTETLADSDLITVVQNGTNKKITKGDFSGQFGLTGTIVQDGAVTGTPILDTQGTVNNIRNIEDGPGIITSITAENGVEIKHNFNFDQAGVPISANPNDAQPLVKSLLQGPGINVATAGNSIQISSTDTPASSRTVTVATIDDFPTAVGGVITLEADTRYLLINSISTSARFVLQHRTSIEGDGNLGLVLTYTGSDTLFTSVDASIGIVRLRINAATGTLFGVTNPADDTSLFVSDVTVDNAASLGSVSDVNILFMSVFRVINTADGILFGGTCGSGVIENAAFDVTGGTVIDLGSSVWNGLILSAAQVVATGSPTFLSGLANNGNVATGGLITVLNFRLFGTITPLSGIANSDSQFQFFLNDNIQDTITDALLSMQGNATNTVISVAGTAVKVAGTWVVEDESQMTGDTTGRATLDTVKDVRLPVDADITVEPVSGGSQSISLYIAINGSIIAGSQRTSTASSGSPTAIAAIWQELLSPGDYVEIFVANDSTTTDLLVSSAILRVN